MKSSTIFVCSTSVSFTFHSVSTAPKPSCSKPNGNIPGRVSSLKVGSRLGTTSYLQLAYTTAPADRLCRSVRLGPALARSWSGRPDTSLADQRCRSACPVPAAVCSARDVTAVGRCPAERRAKELAERRVYKYGATAAQGSTRRQRRRWTEVPTGPVHRTYLQRSAMRGLVATAVLLGLVHLGKSDLSLTCA